MVAMAPPLGMATARTSMAIAGGSGDDNMESELDQSQCHFHLQWRQKQRPQIVKCDVVCNPWRIVLCVEMDDGKKW